MVERFAVGVRGPMSLLCGFTGVPFRSYLLGVAAGSLFGTMPIQLIIGHALRNRPSAVAAIAAVFVSVYSFGPPIAAAMASASLWLGRNKAAGGGSVSGVTGKSDRVTFASDAEAGGSGI